MMELRFKLLAANLVLMAVMALVMLFFVRSVFPRSILSDLQRHWVYQAEELAEEAVGPVLGKDELALRLLVSQHKGIMENAEYVFIADRDGNILMHTFPGGFPADFRKVMAEKRARASRREILLGDKPAFDIAAPVLGGDLGEIHIGFSAKPLMRETNRVTTLIVLTVLCALALQVFFMIIIGAVIIKPIARLKQLATQVRQIGRGQLGENIRVTGRDEVGVLTQAYNEMREDLLAYQRRLRLLATQLTLAEERERRRIASQVHDHIGQTMALVKIKLRSIQEKAPAGNIGKEVENICGVVDAMIQDTRTLVFELSPPVLYELGFVPAMEWLCDHMARTHGVPIDFADDGKPKPLKEDLSVFCFQAGRELLMNVVKHARPEACARAPRSAIALPASPERFAAASRDGESAKPPAEPGSLNSRARAIQAILSLQREGNNLLMTVEDNGAGFDASKINRHAPDTGGFGLFSIRERLSYYGGTITIGSRPGSGARVSIAIGLET